MTQEEFLSKREIINTAITGRTAAVERLRGQLADMIESGDAATEQLTELRPLLAVEKLDRELVDLLIEKIVVYDEQQIEVFWNGRVEN